MEFFDILIGIISILIGYFLGGILPSYIFGKLKGIDIREEGTKNAGTSNAFKVLGLKYAIPTALYDTLKGLLVMLVAYSLGAPFVFVQLSGIATILGHVFPFYLQFRGGQGNATATGILLYYLVVYFSVSLDTFFRLFIVIGLLLVLLVIFTYISKSGSLMPAILFPLLGFSVFVIFPTSGYNLFFVLILIHIGTVGMYKVITEKKLVIRDEVFLSSWWRVAIRPATLLFLVFWLISDVIGIILIGIVTLCFIFLDLSRFLSKQTQELLTVKVKTIFRKGEEKKFSSMTIFLISTFIMVFIFGEMINQPEVAITTLVFLVFGDLFAKVFGLAYGRHKILGKTIEGTLAYCGALIICCYILYNTIDISLPVLVVGAIAAPFAEILPLGMNDNFTVPIISGTVMTVAIFFGL
ncbi:MAG: glycerol-3-phosphate acyltransferase [Candidatus Thorarchaeota archaeon]